MASGPDAVVSGSARALWRRQGPQRPMRRVTTPIAAALPEQSGNEPGGGITLEPEDETVGSAIKAKPRADARIVRHGQDRRLFTDLGRGLAGPRVEGRLASYRQVSNRRDARIHHPWPSRIVPAWLPSRAVLPDIVWDRDTCKRPPR